ncbi:DUF3624 domain-containing protein [Aeromonas enteropelogenes]|uniref:DUF3624 domain-containing protein n=1 Tax=Aeromonas TaxID=642 RepID=UPI0005A61DB5|nr:MULTISPECIES: DUF3624 domain-containing protein [Aeromonas]MBL0457702.1 DUF3624 domain-containing protein [Aeromonas enteropelogenes]MCZ0751701.1 DUF3624 domain-containing protein [Aeromonas enteropelogenes]QXC35401.1 DUF3624 domain-containing protein [Aeromonas sp. FDAARGOS 1407]UAK71919.1 DUF3624 domain-containing protein [Aeromonas enteropelogenes]UBH55503.1 DUF3624 domain-containing protein [Aeromonas enteropelogenes]
MSCDNCLATAIKAKLGRCPVCAAQTFAIGLAGWLAWWWFGADSSVNALTSLLFALAGSGLFALHLLVFLWRKGTGRELDDE